MRCVGQTSTLSTSSHPFPSIFLPPSSISLHYRCWSLASINIGGPIIKANNIDYPSFAPCLLLISTFWSVGWPKLPSHLLLFILLFPAYGFSDVNCFLHSYPLALPYIQTWQPSLRVAGSNEEKQCLSSAGGWHNASKWGWGVTHEEGQPRRHGHPRSSPFEYQGKRLGGKKRDRSLSLSHSPPPLSSNLSHFLTFSGLCLSRFQCRVVASFPLPPLPFPLPLSYSIFFFFPIRDPPIIYLSLNTKNC